MFDFEWPENVAIFLDNLCIYHVCFDLFSFFMIVFTWWFCKARGAVDQIRVDTTTEIHADGEVVADPVQQVLETKKEEESMEDDDFNWHQNDSIMSNLKILKQKALVKELKSKLTEDELEEERKTERMQLEKIFQLLQDQEEKFQMSSMEQLQDQLHLYRL